MKMCFTDLQSYPFFFFVIFIVQAFCEEKESLSSAELYTNDAVKYGRFEVRMRMVAADGVISSFFLWKDKLKKAMHSGMKLTLRCSG